MIYKDIKVITKGFQPTEDEIAKYVAYIMEKHDCKESDIETLRLTLESNDSVTLDYVLHEQKFERIRRITGYLVGTVDRWNDAKRAEERDRVKHA